MYFYFLYRTQNTQFLTTQTFNTPKREFLIHGYMYILIAHSLTKTKTCMFVLLNTCERETLIVKHTF